MMVDSTPGEDLLRWTVGLVGVSWGLGALVTHNFVQALLRKVDPTVIPLLQPGEELPLRKHMWLTRWLTGFIERTFFTVAIAASLPGITIAMVAWGALKGVAHWNNFEGKFRVYAYVGFLGTIVSMMFAMLGGLLAKGDLWSWFGRFSGAE